MSSNEHPRDQEGRRDHHRTGEDLEVGHDRAGRASRSGARDDKQDHDPSDEALAAPGHEGGDLAP